MASTLAAVFGHKPLVFCPPHLEPLGLGRQTTFVAGAPGTIAANLRGP